MQSIIDRRRPVFVHVGDDGRLAIAKDKARLGMYWSAEPSDGGSLGMLVFARWPASGFWVICSA